MTAYTRLSSLCLPSMSLPFLLPPCIFSVLSSLSCHTLSYLVFLSSLRISPPWFTFPPSPLCFLTSLPSFSVPLVSVTSSSPGLSYFISKPPPCLSSCPISTPRSSSFFTFFPSLPFLSPSSPFLVCIFRTVSAFPPLSVYISSIFSSLLLPSTLLISPIPSSLSLSKPFFPFSASSHFYTTSFIFA